jgi:phage-related baseplate assembly protein
MTIFEKPVFAVPDALLAEQELKAKYTELTGKELFPAQPESLLTNWAAYLKTVTDTLIQYTGEQCLVNFANGVNLDRLGDFWDAPRLEAQKSITTLEFTLTAVQGTDYIVPMGTLVSTGDRLFLFGTTDNLIIPDGELSGTVTAECTIAGEEANGYAIGQINSLFDLLSDIANVTNLTVSNSGSGIESDDRYRERLLIAPNKINTAGSRDAYRFFTLSSDPTISSVAVVSPGETQRLQRAIEVSNEVTLKLIDVLGNLGVDTDLFDFDDIFPVIRPNIYFPRFYVEIFILANGALPSVELIEKVQLFLDNNSIRPLTDEVRVLAPVQVEQNIEVEIIASVSANIADLTIQLNTILANYVTEITTSLGVDIVPSQIVQRLQIGGVYEVNVLQPSLAVVVKTNEVAVIPDFSLDIVGVREL